MGPCLSTPPEAPKREQNARLRLGRTWKCSQCPGRACVVGVKPEGLGNDVYSPLPAALLTQDQAGWLLRGTTLNH